MSDPSRSSGATVTGAAGGLQPRAAVNAVLLNRRVLRLRYELRRSIDRLDNQQVRNARRLLAAIRRNPPDVVYLGDSTTSFVSPTDQDRRPLHAMIADGLAPISIHSTFGGSYHADILAAFAGLLRQCPTRPVVIVPLWIRGRYLPWIEHPVFGHKQAMQFIRGITPTMPTWRVRASFPVATAAEFEAFYRLPFPTVVGDELTVGDYVRPLKDPDRFRAHPDERVKLLYAYHQGAALAAGGPEVAAVSRMGAMLRDLGVPIVAYQTPVSLQTGEAIFGGDFAALTRANFAVLDKAFRAGAGDEIDIIQSGTAFAPEEFINPHDADEHLNEIGRRRLADWIVEQAKRSVAAAR